MAYGTTYITTQGAILAAKTLQSKTLSFSHFSIGSGNIADSSVETIKALTGLVNPELNFDITKINRETDTQVTVRGLFKNTDAEEGFWLKELGLYAIDPDTNQQVLFAYINYGEEAEYINNSITEKKEHYYDMIITVDNANNVTITVDPSTVYVNEQELNDAISEAREFVGKNYGVRRKIVDNVLSKWERICDNIGLVANATKNGDEVQNDFDNIYPWSDIITYNYDTTNKKITAYYGEPGFAFDGSNGEVLTRIPEFWYKREVKGDYEYIYISDYNRAGYKHSKEFSVGRYGISVDADGKAHSYSGTIPAYNKTIAAFRTLATAVGDGFCQMDTRYFILQLLYLVEFADYNSQSKLGRGVSEWFNQKALLAENNVNRIIVANSNNMYVGRNISIGTSDAWNNAVASERTITNIEDYSNGSVTGKAVYFDGAAVNIAITNHIWGIGQKSGQCDELGMKSGTLNNDGCHSMIYRGIENIFSNMFTAIDGLNIKDYVAYICDDPTQYASDKFTSPYKEIGYTNLQTSEVYTSKLGYDENNPEVALPIEANGSSGTGTCDYYWCGTGNKLAFVGGDFNTGASAGFFYWRLSHASSHSCWSCGARLLKYQ